MTDEERAREIAARYGDTWPPERKMALTLAIVDALTSTRAEQREKCAQVVEQPFHRCAVSGDVAVPPYVASRIASAIRGMGDKG